MHQINQIFEYKDSSESSTSVRITFRHYKKIDFKAIIESEDNDFYDSFLKRIVKIIHDYDHNDLRMIQNIIYITSVDGQLTDEAITEFLARMEEDYKFLIIIAKLKNEENVINKITKFFHILNIIATKDNITFIYPNNCFSERIIVIADLIA